MAEQLTALLAAIQNQGDRAQVISTEMALLAQWRNQAQRDLNQAESRIRELELQIARGGGLGLSGTAGVTGGAIALVELLKTMM